MIYTCELCGCEFESNSYHVLCCPDCRIQKRKAVAHNNYEKNKKPAPSYIRTCPTCGITFTTTRSRQIYDKTECSLKAYNVRAKKRIAGKPQEVKIKIKAETAKMLKEYAADNNLGTNDAAIAALLHGNGKM